MTHRSAYPSFCFIISALICLSHLTSCDTGSTPSTKTETESHATGDLDQIKTLDGGVTYTLADGEAQHSETPDTFWIPSREKRESLKKDDLVKLVFEISDGSQTQGERMWVIVTGGDRSGYTGILDNDPYSTDQIKAGLEVTFKPKHVIDIYELDRDEQGQEDSN